MSFGASMGGGERTGDSAAPVAHEASARQPLVQASRMRR